MPDFVPLENLYTRALQILGVATPGSTPTELNLRVQPVSIISDVSDASVPHSNPVFGFSFSITPVAAEFSAIELTATSRLLRVRQIRALGATNPRLQVVPVGFIDNLAAPVGGTGVSIGPISTDAGTAIFNRGTSTVSPNTGAFIILNTQFDVRPPLLIAPGQSLIIADSSANVAATFGVIWEEIPAQIQIASVGFPA